MERLSFFQLLGGFAFFDCFGCRRPSFSEGSRFLSCVEKTTEKERNTRPLGRHRFGSRKTAKSEFEEEVRVGLLQKFSCSNQLNFFSTRSPEAVSSETGYVEMSQIVSTEEGEGKEEEALGGIGLEEPQIQKWVNAKRKEEKNKRVRRHWIGGWQLPFGVG
jgi:hypothetical protein